MEPGLVLLLAMTVIGAVIRGGPVERAGAALFVAGGLASLGLQVLHETPSLWLALVDVAVLLGLVRLSWRSPRPWPVYAAGFQTLTTAADVARWVRPDLDPDLQRTLLTALGFLVVGTLAVGVLLPPRPVKK